MAKSNDFKKQYSQTDSVIERDLFGMKESIDVKEGKNNFKVFKAFKIVIPIFLIVLIYILALPFIPEIFFRVPDIVDVEYEEQRYILDSGNNYDDIVFEENRLIIPVIGVNVEIVEGEDESALSRGVWRRPGTGTPDKGGNVVITGHRFYYVPPNNQTFYNLDKLDVDRKVFVYWEGEQYVYKVFDTFIVDDTRVDIEENLSGNILTLYTCHPLWTADKRLVVRAELENDL